MSAQLECSPVKGEFMYVVKCCTLIKLLPLSRYSFVKRKKRQERLGAGPVRDSGSCPENKKRTRTISLDAAPLRSLAKRQHAQQPVPSRIGPVNSAAVQLTVQL